MGIHSWECASCIMHSCARLFNCIVIDHCLALLIWTDAHRQPAIVEIQILRVGQLVILCVPGELTTMAGRRLREAVHQQVRAHP